MSQDCCDWPINFKSDAKNEMSYHYDAAAKFLLSIHPIAPHNSTKTTAPQKRPPGRSLLLCFSLVIQYSTGVTETVNNTGIAVNLLGWCWMCLLDDCEFISGSYSWKHDSSLVITVFRKAGISVCIIHHSCKTSRQTCEI